MLPYGLDLAPIDAGREHFDPAAARREAGIPEDAELVICVGTVEPRKAQLPLAQAFELIAESHPDAAPRLRRRATTNSTRRCCLRHLLGRAGRIGSS